MELKAIEDELQYRIESDKAYFGGTFPNRNALAWRAYLSGLLEWSIIDRPMFDRLSANLPEVGENWLSIPASRHPQPSAEVIVQELQTRIEKDVAQSGTRLPEPKVIFWRAYLSGLLEWSVIHTGFPRLMSLLPVLDDDPARAILTGRPPPGGDTW